MARRTTQTAKTVEKGVEARIRQRGARPSENGTNPGGAAVLKTDVSKLTPAQCESWSAGPCGDRSSLLTERRC